MKSAALTKTIEGRLLWIAGLVALLVSIAASGVAHAAGPERLELKPTDRVFWKGKGGENYLILNVFDKDAQLKALPKTDQNVLLLNTALVEGARLFARPEHKQLGSVSVLLVSMKDMSEYGGAKGGWTQVGLATLLKGDTTLQLKDVKLDGALPSPLPTLPFPFQETSTSAAPNAVGFMMPEKIYLVAGTGQQVFYDDLVLVKVFDDVLFVPEGDALGFAAQNRRSLDFAPTEANVGDHVLKIKVTDWDGKIIAEGSTKVVVVPANAGQESEKADPLRILIVGHSLPSMYWPAYFADYLSGPGNPKVEFIGGIKYWYGNYPDFQNHPPLDSMYHQASPGYSVQTMLTLYSDEPPANPNMPSKSPFIFKDGNGPPHLDMRRYLKEALHDKVPDIVLLNIGDNDTFNLDPDADNSAVERQFIANMNEFLNHLREIAPKAIFGAVMPNSYNYSERSFIVNYGPTYTRWRQLRNRHRYIELMAEVAKSRSDLQIIPSNLVVDGIDGMPYNSGTHFNNRGARQFAGASYAWLKAQFPQRGAATTAAAPAPAAAPSPVLRVGWLDRIKGFFGK
ncbi:SGNH/GDSL hydrolase family protein [Bradyrhizobium septentrionale]|uniref:SGNH/GDSL hydrolase family protein n=1 Tax=Bradyrhizobium septentrionale TaxID=1404411 RepID=UPI00159693E2|nr:SGNH/GDSL hydrolase family protein [Bradyrhizobium septentrionale]UGY22037.1 SGNH/GDSL hydrolase family protein [Bradyrhizobium septentrionale]